MIINIEKKHLYIFLILLVVFATISYVKSTGYDPNQQSHTILYSDVIRGKSSSSVTVNDDLIVSEDFQVGEAQIIHRVSSTCPGGYARIATKGTGDNWCFGSECTGSEVLCVGSGCGDGDSDSYADISCGGSDCNDNEYRVHPSSIWSYGTGLISNAPDVNCNNQNQWFWSPDGSQQWIEGASSRHISNIPCSQRYNPGDCVGTLYESAGASDPTSCGQSRSPAQCSWNGNSCVTSGSLTVYSRCN